MSRFVRTLGKLTAALLAALILVVIAAVIAVNVSPKPFTWFIQRQFAMGIGITPVTPALFYEVSPAVRVERDVTYPSRFGSNRIDVFSPEDASSPLPTIIWVHGGGFVGGDKAGIETWATMIAGHGYTVVSINYDVAPAVHYPAPLIQLGDVYQFLKQNAHRYPTIDLNRLIIGGDSAGAQIASQFVAVQTNVDLARSMEIAALIPEDDLIAVILYCGPYNLQRLYDAAGWFSRFFVRQIGWAYFGLRHWQDTPEAIHASMVQHVTSTYPPVFITDGNSGSFEADAKELEGSLRVNDVYVESLYFAAARGTVGHEYQFDFALPESLECFNRTLAFLAHVTEEPAMGAEGSTRRPPYASW